MENHLIQLERESIFDKSFLHVAKLGFGNEFKRIIRSKNAVVSHKAKQEALHVICRDPFFIRIIPGEKFFDDSENMILDLISVGKIKYASEKIFFSWATSSKSKIISDRGSLFHFACVRGYSKLIELLLKDPSIDTNVRTDGGKNGLLLAVIREDQSCLKILLQSKRIEVRESMGDINWSVWYSRHMLPQNNQI